MKLELRLKRLFFPLALVSIGVLALIPGVAPPFVGAFVLILLPGYFLNPRNEPFTGYTIAWHIAVLVFLLWTMVDLIASGNIPHVTIAYQLAFIILYKMLTPKRPRSYFEIWYFCLAAFLLAGFAAHSALFVALATAFAILSVFAIAHMTLLREAERTARDADPESAKSGKLPALDRLPLGIPIGPGRTRRRMSRALTAATVMILLVSVAMFFAFPRFNSRGLPMEAAVPSAADSNMVLTGLSDFVSLGSLGQILEDESEALRVSVSPPLIDAAELYLRGGALDYFDGISWKRSSFFRYLPVGTAAPPTRNAPPDPGSGLISQRIVYTGLTTNIVYALPNVRRLEMPSRGQFDINPAGIIFMRSTERDFRVVSDFDYLDTRPLVYAPLYENRYSTPDTVASNENYLQVPESLRSLTMTHFVARIVNDAETPAERAAAIQEWLRSNCTYTLDLRGYSTNNPVYEFLVDRREGHCEFFATSMVMMLRTAGVPARLATGFRGGLSDVERGPGNFIVRNRDVHTWVEAWLPGEGWHMYDPTPPPPLEVLSGNLAFMTLRRWMERMHKKANLFVIGYDRDRQESLAHWSKQALTAIGGPAQWWRAIKRVSPWGAGLGIALLMTGIFMWMQRWHARRLSGKPDRPQQPAAAARQIDETQKRRVAFAAWMRRKFIGALGGAEHHVQRDATLREYVLELARRRAYAPADQVQALAKIYYAVRFGNLDPTSDLRDDVRRRLAALTSAKSSD